MGPHELAAVTKTEVDDRLEPLTGQHVDEFYQCRACGHARRLVDETRARVRHAPSDDLGA